MKSLTLRTFDVVLQGLLRGLLRAWWLVLVLVPALTLVRLAQLGHYWPAGFRAPASDVARVLVLGLRFDLKVAAVAGLLLLPLSTWVGARAQARIVAGAVWVFVMLSLINLHYFGFYKTPIDALVFGLAEDDTAAIFRTIWSDFPVLLTTLAALVLTAAAVLAYRGLARRLDPDAGLRGRHAAATLAVVGLAFVTLLFAGKGTLRAMALQRQNFTVTTSQFLNDMVPNGAIALNYAWDSRSLGQDLQDPLAGLTSRGFDTPLVAAAALGLPHGSEAEVLAALRAHEPLPAGAIRKNLVFFLMESWSAEPLLYQAPKFDVLGRLAPTLAGACHFSNFDSAQGGTHTTLEAILFSTPISPLTQGDVGRRPIPWSIARVVQQAGYQTLFLTSGRAGWRDLNRVLKVQGFDEVVDASGLMEAYPEATMGVWGIWDGYLFRYLSRRLAAQPAERPLFVFVLTSSNHPPYDLPAEDRRVPRDMALWRGETASDTLLPNLDTYHYAADLLGGFVQEVLGGPLAPHTLVAATGDHNVRSFGVYAEPARRHLLHQVPFVIWGQGLDCGEQQALPASHRDMFPTLLPLAGIVGPYLNSGRNLLRPLPPAPDPMNAPRALYFAGEARTARGVWQLGNKDSYTCSPVPPAGAACRFDPLADLQERARLALLDWNVRVSLKK
jgi:phosphoglycerol transferase MdoB-like AlkP superfamily enzyme